MILLGFQRSFAVLCFFILVDYDFSFYNLNLGFEKPVTSDGFSDDNFLVSF